MDESRYSTGCGTRLGSNLNGYIPRCGGLWMGQIIRCDKCHEKYEKKLKEQEKKKETE